MNNTKFKQEYLKIANYILLVKIAAAAKKNFLKTLVRTKSEKVMLCQEASHSQSQEETERSL